MRPTPDWAKRSFLFCALLISLFGGLGPPASPEEPEQAASPDNLIPQRFGIEMDPGLRLPTDSDLSIASVYGLAFKTIVIDPGHGGKDPGARGATGLTEKTITLDVARRLERRLVSHGFQVRLTRNTDTSMTIRERVNFAVRQNADILVSIHVNAHESSPRSAIETYYFDARGTPATVRLARRENINSGFTIADWREQVRALASTLKQEESKRLAECIQAALLETVQQYSPLVEDRGARGGPFAVLSNRWRHEKGPELLAIPAILTEIAVINHPPDEEKLVSDEYREHLAGALFDGIVRFASADSSNSTVTMRESVHHPPL